MQKKITFLSEKPRNLTRHKVILFCVLIFVHALDAFFSNIFMSVDLSNEANRFMAYVYENLGGIGVWMVKAIAFVPLAILLPYIRPWVLWAMIIIMIPVTIFGGIMASGMS